MTVFVITTAKSINGFGCNRLIFQHPMSINRLHDRVNAIVKLLLFETRIKHLRDTKEINLRQYAILTQVLERGKPLQIEELRRSPWYEALYGKLADKTKQRDLSRLREQRLLHVDEKGFVRPGFMRSK